MGYGGYDQDQHQQSGQSEFESQVIVQQPFVVEPPPDNYSWVWTGVLVPIIIAWMIHRAKKKEKS